MPPTRDNLTWLARVGHGAKAIVYLTLGYLIFQAAFNSGSMPDQQSVAQQLGGWGKALLWATAIGLGFYAIWRGAQAGGVGTGDDTKKRLGAAGSMIANGVLAALFALTALGMGAGSKGWGQLLDNGWGRLLVGLVGGCFAIAGIYQFVIAKRESYMESIETPSSKAQGIIRQVGKVAYASRGVVFLMLSAGLLLSAVQAQKAQFSSLSGALRQLAEQPAGPWLLVAVATGLIGYGIVAGLMSRYVVAED